MLHFLKQTIQPTSAVDEEVEAQLLVIFRNDPPNPVEMLRLSMHMQNDDPWGKPSGP